METMVGAIAVSVVLILALYGMSKLLELAGERLLYPRRNKAMLLLCLEDSMTDAEWQVRVSQHIASKEKLPLYVLDRTTNAEIRRIAAWLLSEGGGDMGREIPFEKMSFGSCEEDGDCV